MADLQLRASMQKYQRRIFEYALHDNTRNKIEGILIVRCTCVTFNRMEHFIIAKRTRKNYIEESLRKVTERMIFKPVMRENLRNKFRYQV